MSPEGWYRVEEFAPGTYQLTEGGRWKMFLFIGDEKALLLDGGVGFGDLRALCESLTDKPIDHVLTHTHWDHVGSAHQWDSVGVHPNGKDQLTDDHAARCAEAIAKWGDGLPFPPGFEPEGYKIRPGKFSREVKEGDVIDLGGRTLRVWDTPGHSPCSISLLDDREGVLITGDLVKPLQPLNLRVATAVLSDYGPALRKLEKVAAENEVKWVCSGHTDAFPDSSIIGEMAEFVEGIAGGKHDPPRKMAHPSGVSLDVYMGTRFSVWVADSARR
jgi:glyoxylase-like metal-dependent hydrolase (beta-lactamase superfamily II)